MTEYTLLWLGMFTFLVIGVLTSILFFRRGRRLRRRRDLDSILFQ